MENTTNSTRQFIDINVRAYRFTELNDDAQERVFRDWRDSGALADAYYREVEDIDAAFTSFLEYLDYPTTPDGYGRASGWYRLGTNNHVAFDRVDYDEAAARCYEVDDYLGTGDCYGWDMARAWNEWVPKLRTIRGVVEGADYSEEVCTRDNLTGAFFKALQSVARAHNDAVESAFSYYYCAEGAREWWDEGEWEWTDDRWYDSDGRDITRIVERYAWGR